MKKTVCLMIIGLALTGFWPGKGMAAAPNLYLPGVFKDYCANQHLSLNFLAFGDSITGCYYDSYYQTVFPYCGYEKRVFDWLNRNFGYCRNQLAFYNKSEGGETTTDGWVRFPETITNPNDPLLPSTMIRLYPKTATVIVPGVVIIMEGTNDMNVGTGDFIIETNLRQMVAFALSQGKKVILSTIPPAFGPYEVERQQRIAQFNPTIFQIGLEMGIPIADVYSRLVDHPEWAAEDGLHFNDAGFDQMADVFYQAIVALPGFPNLIN